MRIVIAGGHGQIALLLEARLSADGVWYTEAYAATGHPPASGRVWAHPGVSGRIRTTQRGPPGRAEQ